MAELTPTSRISKWIWIPVVVLALAYLARVHAWRIERVEVDSQFFTAAEATEPSSPTGFTQSQRNLIVPERNEDSLQWIMQTQQMFAQREWRVRHVDYDNAPDGRAVSAPSAYRWYLGAIAYVDHTFTGRPLGLAVTHAALYADPVLQALGALGLTCFAAYAFGGWAAALFALGFATLFPFSTLFQPGEPDDRGLAMMAALAELLVVVWALQTNSLSPSFRKRWSLAGILGGLGFWISVQTAVPTWLGVSAGGLLTAVFWRGGKHTSTVLKLHKSVKLPTTAVVGAAVEPSDGSHVFASASAWRRWSYAGAVVTLLAWLAEYFPGHWANWNVEFVHPLYALAWLGLGEILAQLTLVRTTHSKGALRASLICLLGIATLAPIAFIMVKVDTRGFLAVDLLAQRLTKLPLSAVANSTWTWLLRDGFTPQSVATLLALLAAGLAVFSVRDTRVRCAVFGIVAVYSGFALSELTFWSAVDIGALIAIVAAASDLVTALTSSDLACNALTARARTAAGALFGSPAPKPKHAVALAGAVLLLAVAGLAGARQAWPAAESRAGATLTAASAQLLIERDLAHWLAQRTGGSRAVVLASPRVTMSQAFYGNLRGIGTVNTDNRGGLGATIAMISATTMEEAQALMAQRQVSYLVIPSWDPFFEDYTHLYLAKNFAGWHPFFIPQLRQWHLPAWLRPVPFEMPPIGGYEGQSVLVFQIVPDQNPAVAAGRLAEYFIESGRTYELATADEMLRRFPADVGALAARAHVAAARSDDAANQQIMQALAPRLRAGGDRFLQWDRRVSLTIALARGGQMELAQAQVRRCIQEMDLSKARSLSTGFLFNLLVVANALHVEVADPTVRHHILELLSPDLRSQVAR